MVSKKILRMGAQKTPIQKTYETNIGADSINFYFFGSNRQFHRLELSLVYDKSDKHTTIFDSYNAELAAKTIKLLLLLSVKLSNFTEIYSLTNEKKYDIDNLTQKYLLCKQFVAWSCNGSSVAPLTDYISNPIYQELIDEDDYFKTKSDERICLDLRAISVYTNEAEKIERSDSKFPLSIMLKAAASKKLKLRVWVHSIKKYLYILSKSGLALRQNVYYQ